MFPYLDQAGFRLRTVMQPADVDSLTIQNPGWLEQRIRSWSSYINARLRKRYGNAPTVGNSLPLGQQPPALVASGTAPPPVALTGRPTLGSLEMLLAITTGGALGTAQFKWSLDNGVTFTTGVLTAASVVLGTTGLSASFPAGTYGTDNQYAAATPVPDAVLDWLTALVQYDGYRKRGVNPQDPLLEMVAADRQRALDELKEAADSKDGLFDLPVSEDLDSAVTTGGPLGYAEQSPYTWTDIEADRATQEDGFRQPPVTQ